MVVDVNACAGPQLIECIMNIAAGELT
jgi:hypothetical protein